MRDARLPDDLERALREWAAVAQSVVASGDAREVDLLRRRGRQLAARAAERLGRPVRFVDPVSGAVEAIRGTGAVPSSGAHRADRVALAEDAGDRPAPAPTPWGTGTAVAVYFAVLVALADIALGRAFADAFGLLWVPANLLVTAGTVPSLWLARDVPFWRWPALGAAAGLAAAWVVLLLGLLAP